MFYTCWCSLPLNMQFALGRALFDLFAVTGKSMYLQRAVGLCTAFNAALMKTPNNVTWLYWPAGRDSSIEDTSHGFIDVDFALMCYERGGWMTHDTLTLIAKTLNDVMLNGAEPDGAPRVALTVKGFVVKIRYSWRKEREREREREREIILLIVFVCLFLQTATRSPLN